VSYAPSKMLLGPDGRPLRVSTALSKAELVRWVKAETGEEIVDGVIVDEVAKRVRSQATSLTQVWDPHRGKPKPTPVTWETLRMMAHRNEWARAIIKTRKNQIGSVKWRIVPRDDDDSSASTRIMCEEMTKLLNRPSMRGSRPHSRSWRQFIGEVLEDVLVLDAGCIEKERDANGWIRALYPVDGATIRPNIDEYGGYRDDAYVQVVDGQVTARFGMEDLLYIMDNPSTDLRFAGYGFSPLEHMIVSVTAELFASKFNSSYFEKGAIPEGILNLGEDVAPEDVDAFRLYWMNEIMGKPWAIPIVAGKNVAWQQWRDSHKDMQFMEYQSWLLKKMCAGYQISPQEVGELEDVNRSTAQDQNEINKSKSLQPILTLIADMFEVELIGQHGQGLGDYIEFEWIEEKEDEALIDQKFSVRVQEGMASRNEWREAVNMEPSDEEGADMLLVAGQLNPLPSKEDVAVMGAAAQQQQQEEQQKQQMDQQQMMGGGGPGSMPWKPAQAQSPEVQNAMRSQRSAASAGMGPISGVRAPVRQMGGALGKQFDDRNPSLTEREVEFDDLWDRHHDELLEKLSRILGVPSGVDDEPD
jgi:HK97 family phage portal protein